MKSKALLLAGMLMVVGACSSETNNQDVNDNTRPTVATHTISGHLVDPYVRDALMQTFTPEGVLATICTELGTQPCQTGSDDQGEFTFVVKDGVDLSNHMIVSHGGIDTVLGTNFGAVSFKSVLGSFVDNNTGDISDVVVSPITTLVAEKVSGGMSLQNAIADVARIVDLSEEDVIKDPMTDTEVAKRTLLVSSLMVDGKSVAEILTAAQSSTIFEHTFADLIYADNSDKAINLKAMSAIITDPSYAGGSITPEQLTVEINNQLKFSSYNQSAKLSDMIGYPADENVSNSYIESVKYLISVMESASGSQYQNSYDMMSALFGSMKEFSDYYGDYTNYEDVSGFKSQLDADMVFDNGTLTSRAYLVATGRYQVDIALAQALDGSNQSLLDYYLRSNISNFENAYLVTKSITDNEYLNEAYALIAEKYAKYGLYEYGFNFVNAYGTDPTSKVNALRIIAENTYKYDRAKANEYMEYVEKTYVALLSPVLTLGGAAYTDYVTSFSEVARVYYINGEVEKADNIDAYLKANVYDKLSYKTDPRQDYMASQTPPDLLDYMDLMMDIKDYQAVLDLQDVTIDAIEYYISSKQNGYLQAVDNSTIAAEVLTYDEDAVDLIVDASNPIDAINYYTEIISKIGIIAMNNPSLATEALNSVIPMLDRLIEVSEFPEIDKVQVDGGVDADQYYFTVVPEWGMASARIAQRAGGISWALYMKNRQDGVADPVAATVDTLETYIYELQDDGFTYIPSSRAYRDYMYDAVAHLAVGVTLVEGSQAGINVLTKYLPMDTVDEFDLYSDNATLFRYKMVALNKAVLESDSYIPGAGLLNIVGSDESKKDLIGDFMIHVVDMFKTAETYLATDRTLTELLVGATSISSGTEARRYGTTYGGYLGAAKLLANMGLNDNATTALENASALFGKLADTATYALVKSYGYGNIAKQYLDMGYTDNASSYFEKARSTEISTHFASVSSSTSYYYYHLGIARDYALMGLLDDAKTSADNATKNISQISGYTRANHYVIVAQFLASIGLESVAIDGLEDIKDYLLLATTTGTASQKATAYRNRVILPLTAYGELEKALDVVDEVYVVTDENGVITPDYANINYARQYIAGTLVRANAFADEPVIFAGAVTLNDPVELLPAFSDIDKDGKADFFLPSATPEYIASYGIEQDDDIDDDGIRNDADFTPFNYVAP